MLLVLAMPVEWRGRYVSFSLIAARLDLSVGAVRAALFAKFRQSGLYFVDAKDSPKTITHVASGSLIEPPRPQGVHDLGDRVTENNLMIVAGDETRQSRSTKRQVVDDGPTLLPLQKGHSYNPAHLTNRLPPSARGR